MFVLHGHRLCRDVAAVLIIQYVTISYLKLEIGDQRDLEYGYTVSGGGEGGGELREGEGEEERGTEPSPRFDLTLSVT